MAEDSLEIVIDIGEDWVGQIFWTDDYGQPIPATEPIVADVKDANGQIAIRFISGSDPTTQPHIQSAGFAGFFQLSVPSAWTTKLTPGRYVFDLFAAVADSAPPFEHQAQKVVSGYVIAEPRVTIVETVDLVNLEAP